MSGSSLAQPHHRITRAVAARDVTSSLGPPDLSARPFGTSVAHKVDASPDVVFHAWVDRFDHWFAEPGAIRMMAEVGAPYFFETLHEGERHPHYGRILALEPGRLLEMTWLNEAGTHGVETVLRVEIAPDGNGSRLCLTHTGFHDETTSAEHGEAWQRLLRDRLDPMLARLETRTERERDG